MERFKHKKKEPGGEWSFSQAIGQAFSGERCASIASVTCPLATPPYPRPRRGPRSVASPADPVGGRVSEDRVFGVGAGVASPSLAHFPLPQSRWAISDVHFGAILGIPIAFGLETRSFPK